MAIGHVTPISSNHQMVNPVFADFIAGAGEVYARAGYDMLLPVVNDVDEERIYRDLMARQTVDGIIMHGPRAGDWRLPLLHDLGLRFVAHGREAPRPTTGSTSTTGAPLRGRRRYCWIWGTGGSGWGYEEALARAGIAPCPALMQADEMTEGHGHRAGDAMLALPDPPSAFVVSSIILVIGLRRALGDLGLRMGSDISPITRNPPPRPMKVTIMAETVITHDDNLGCLRNSGIFTPQGHRCGRRGG